MSSKLEKEVGICSYISDHKGFFGIIKQRFSDFQVNEITSQGEIVHLTSVKVIPIPSSEKPISVVISKPPEVISKPPEIQDEEVEMLKQLSSPNILQNLIPSAIIVKSSDNSGIKIVEEKKKSLEQVLINVNEVTKERRTVLHMYIKSQFPTLNSTTKDIDGKKVICVTLKGNNNTQRKDKRSSWPASQRYVTFVLYKENIDTMDAINYISGKLRLRPSAFAYAGTKDKRAKTSQLVSILQVSPQNLSSSIEKISKIEVGNFTFGNKPQKLGLSSGNHFRIALREVDDSEEEIEKGLTSLKEKGFINYYGMQRFSSSNVSTHTIGRAILQGKWQEAVDLILSPRDNDSSDLSEAKKIWKEKRDAPLALKSLMSFKRSSIEGRLLSGLAERGSKNYVNALEKVPRNMNLMYIHAYQSYIWNSVLSRRIEKYKLDVIPGDLIRTRLLKRISNNQKSSSCEEITSNDENDEDCEEDEEQQNCNEKSAHILTSEEAKNVDITDVIMPLPGYNIIYPNNEIKDWYKELLEKDSLSFDMFRHKVRTFSLGGSYRSIVVRPQKLEYSSCYYDDPTLSLIQSDLDDLESRDVTSNRLKSGKHKALLLEFSLPPSSYATMVLRELMKTETSSAYQASLNSRSKDLSNENEDKESEAIEDANTKFDDNSGSMKRANDLDDKNDNKRIKTR